VTTLSIPELAQYARAAGWSGDGLVMIVAIALRESGGQPSVIGDIDNPHAGCRSYGLVQINVCPTGTAGGNNAGNPWRMNPTSLLDPVTNFRAAYEMSNGGKNFGPWTTYRSGIAPADTARVRAALAGDPSATSSTGDPTPGAALTSATPGPADGYAIFGWLTKWETWQRILLIMGGGAAIVAGVLIYKRETVGKSARSAASATSTMLRGENEPDDGADDGATDTNITTASTLGA